MYEVYALCTGEKTTPRSQFLYRDASSGDCTISFYFWVVLGPEGPIVADCSFDAEEARRRGVCNYRERTELLDACGVKPSDVKRVFMTHLHYDHWAGYPLFPHATYFIQRREIDFWRGDGGAYSMFSASANMDAIAGVDALVQAGRVRIVDGDWTVAPGLEAYLVGGHTPGLQMLSVASAAGDVLVASDTFHFYENLCARKPVQVTVNMREAIQAMERVCELSNGHPERAVPGHDPLVMQRYRRIAPGVVRVC